MSATAADTVRFALGLLVVVAVTAALAHGTRLGLAGGLLTAVPRAAVQLTVVALLLGGALTLPWAAGLFVVLMLTTASWTAGGRVRDLWHGRRAAAAGVCAGAGATLALTVALGLVEPTARQVLAVAGILIGNGMSAATLAGRGFQRAGVARRGEVEGWLALGAAPPTAWEQVRREAVRETLVPTLDQTRSTGLVTLPGAFVGALAGGASPAQAARFQLVVLAGIALTATITALVVTTVAARSGQIAQDRVD